MSAHRTRARAARLLPCALFAILSFALSDTAPAQPAPASVPITVLVTDPTGAVIPGATIRLIPESPGTPPAQQRTDNHGLSSTRLAPGAYRLHVERPGFAPSDQSVRVDLGTARELHVSLSLPSHTDTVEARTEGFAAEEASTAARLPLRLAETPQQIDVLTPELLQSRAVESMKQAMEMIPAAGLQLGEARRDNFFLRGFNALGDMYLDGVRDDAQYYRDLSNTDRIEVLEGPAAVLYGRGSSGGLINRVTKRPQLEGTLGELTYTAGSYGDQRGTADLDTLIPGTNRTVGFRLTGAAEHDGSHRHDYWMNRYTFAPTLLWKPSPNTDLRLAAERLRDDRLPDRGIPYLPSTGLPAPVPVGNFYGYVGPLAGSNFIHSAVTNGSAELRHSFTDGWTIHLTGRVAGYATNFVNMYVSSLTLRTDGGYNALRGEYNGAQNWRLAFGNEEATRAGRWLHMQHTILLGSEQGLETTDAFQYTGATNQSPVDLLNPQPVAPFLSTTLARNNRFAGKTGAGYAQDLVSAGSRWKFLLGVRGDRFGQSLVLRPPTTPNLARADWAASPRVGIVFAARPSTQLYLNYTRTFDPSGENLSLATNNAQLKPEVTQNYEGGAKWDLLRRRLLLTTNFFRLDRTNIKTTDPNDPTALLNLGEQRTDGAELNAQGELSPHWHIYGGYAWLDGRIVSSTTLSNGILLQGRRPAMTALHNATLWTSYDFRNGFGVAGGLVGKSAQFAATDNLARLPGYTRLDASAYYRRARYEVQVHLQNLGNRRFYDAAQNDYQIYPAAPINGSATLRYRF